jgi:hypothetical protein
MISKAAAHTLEGNRMGCPSAFVCGAAGLKSLQTCSSLSLSSSNGEVITFPYNALHRYVSVIRPFVHVTKINANFIV